MRSDTELGWAVLTQNGAMSQPTRHEARVLWPGQSEILSIFPLERDEPLRAGFAERHSPGRGQSEILSIIPQDL